MASIVRTGTGFPPHYYEQDELIRGLAELWADKVYNFGRLEQFHRNVLVGGRHLALPMETYRTLTGFGARNAAWTEVATDLGSRVVGDLCEEAGIAPRELSLLVFTTVTGLAVPSIEARLMNRLPLSPALKRLPIFGLGCLAGAAGVARVADYLKGHPDECALLLAIELCSLTLQADDLSVANIVASGLFGDGAAAVLMAGERHPAAGQGPRLIDTRSVFFPDSERVMGWDVQDSGFKVVLSPEVPDFAREHLSGPAAEFLALHGLSAREVTHWIAHPGGPRVMDALEQSLGLPDGALDVSRDSLARVGNVSSASVLFVLDELLKSGRAAPGDYGVMLAMGPAFCAELVLLQW